MYFPYGGLIVIVIYGITAEVQAQSFHLITQNDIDILTQDSLNILVSVP